MNCIRSATFGLFLAALAVINLPATSFAAPGASGLEDAVLFTDFDNSLTNENGAWLGWTFLTKIDSPNSGFDSKFVASLPRVVAVTWPEYLQLIGLLSVDGRTIRDRRPFELESNPFRPEVADLVEVRPQGLQLFDSQSSAPSQELITDFFPGYYKLDIEFGYHRFRSNGYNNHLMTDFEVALMNSDRTGKDWRGPAYPIFGEMVRRGFGQNVYVSTDRGQEESEFHQLFQAMAQWDAFNKEGSNPEDVTILANNSSSGNLAGNGVNRAKKVQFLEDVMSQQYLFARQKFERTGRVTNFVVVEDHPKHARQLGERLLRYSMRKDFGHVFRLFLVNAAEKSWRVGADFPYFVNELKGGRVIKRTRSELMSAIGIKSPNDLGYRGSEGLMCRSLFGGR